MTTPTLDSHDLFPTRIWQTRLRVPPSQQSAWLADIVALRAAQPAPAGRTVRGGWNSVDMNVLGRAAFAPLNEAVRSACVQALTQMGQQDLSFRLNAWVNLHEQGGFNFLHMHEGSLLSGSYYLQVPPGSGDFVFRDPRPGVINAPAKGAGINCHSDIHLTPSEGLLVLFPCWLEHYVEPHVGRDPRIAIAFNAVHG